MSGTATTTVHPAAAGEGDEGEVAAGAGAEGPGEADWAHRQRPSSMAAVQMATARASPAAGEGEAGGVDGAEVAEQPLARLAGADEAEDAAGAEAGEGAGERALAHRGVDPQRSSLASAGMASDPQKRVQPQARTPTCPHSGRGTQTGSSTATPRSLSYLKKPSYYACRSPPQQSRRSSSSASRRW